MFFLARLPLPHNLQAYPGLSGLGSPNQNFDNNAGSNRSIVEQGLLAAVPQQQQPQHAAAMRMLDLAGNAGGGGQTGPPGLPPSGSNGAANGFPNGLNMNIKDNNPSPASESPVPPSKLTPPVGIPFQVLYLKIILLYFVKII